MFAYESITMFQDTFHFLEGVFFMVATVCVRHKPVYKNSHTDNMFIFLTKRIIDSDFSKYPHYE